MADACELLREAREGSAAAGEDAQALASLRAIWRARLAERRRNLVVVELTSIVPSDIGRAPGRVLDVGASNLSLPEAIEVLATDATISGLRLPHGSEFLRIRS